MFENFNIKNANHCECGHELHINDITELKKINNPGFFGNIFKYCSYTNCPECGKEISDKYKGVPLNKEVHKDVIINIIDSFKENGYFINGLTYSPIKGGNGNIEYLACFRRDNFKEINIDSVINDAFKL